MPYKNLLLTKLVRSRWLDIGLVLFFVFMDLDFVSVHKNAKREFGQYPAILTSRLVNNIYTQAIVNAFRVCIAWNKHERGWENSRQLCKPSISSRVCITVENSPNPTSAYITLCKHRIKAFYCFYKITSSKDYNAEKIKNHFSDQNLSSYNINLTMAFLKWPIKTYILKICWSAMWRVYNFTSHNHVYILSCKHASRPIRARVLS